MNRQHLSDYEHFHSSEIYGTGGKCFPDTLPHIMALSPKSLIDYGAGRSKIAYWLGREANMEHVACFDPAVPEISQIPEEKFDVVVSFDVLEHIPEEEMDAVLSEMAKVATHALLIIDIAPAKATLSDGRNAHVSLHDESWWQDRLAQYFPSIRPFKINRPHRVAFKTWENDLPGWKQFFFEKKGRYFLKWSRFRSGRKKSASRGPD